MQIKMPVDLAGLLQYVTKEVETRVARRTPVRLGRAQRGWHSEVDTSTLTAEISNQVPYIGILEEGSSDQAPNGMVRITLEEVPEIIKSYKESK
jgi:hypothetical protein